MKPAGLLFTLMSLLTLSLAAQAQTVALAGMLGNKALLIVDGSVPKGLAAGESFRGVKLMATRGDHAVVQIDGKSHTLRVGEAPASVNGGAGADAVGNKVVLSAGGGGHFMAQGQVNGKAVSFMVDTGATYVVISQAEAERAGLSYKTGPTAQLSTANGVIPGWRLKLGSVRIGDVVAYEVDAIVSSGLMPYVLLGNSFLTRFQMTRTNDQMVLEKRY